MGTEETGRLLESIAAYHRHSRLRLKGRVKRPATIEVDRSMRPVRAVKRGFVIYAATRAKRRHAPVARTTGITLLEIMVTLAVITITLGVGIPLADSLVSNNRIATQANDFVATLVLARSEAVKRRVPVSLCASVDQATCADSTDWSTGWIVFSDNSGVGGLLDGTDTLIHAHEALSGSSNFTASTSAVRYGRNGSLSTTVGSVFTLEGGGCNANGKRIITVMPSGYSSLDKAACS